MAWMGKEAKSERCKAHGGYECQMCSGGKMAEGGDANDPKGIWIGNPKNPNDPPTDYAKGGDIITQIMRKRMGKMADEHEEPDGDEPIVDSEPNEFDVMVADDNEPEFHETEENSGDDIGNAEEDKEDHSLISQIMASRRKKDRMPRPA